MAQNNVVVGTVVQPTAVGQPVGALPATYADPADYQRRQDANNAGIGWVIYGVGWFVCLCCGPCGPIFWFVIACMHYCKPKEVQDQNPQEKVVAQVSLCTAICCTIVTVFMLILYVGVIAVAVANAESNCATECSSYAFGLSPGETVCYDGFTQACTDYSMTGDEKTCASGKTLCKALTPLDDCAGFCDSATSESYPVTFGTEVCFYQASNKCTESEMFCNEGGIKCKARR